MHNLTNSVENLAMLIPLTIYFAVLMYLGFVGFRKTKNFSDYVLGSRKLGAIVGALNVGASDMSSWLLMGLPGAFYISGLNQIWMVLGLIFGSYLSWKIVAVRLRKYSEKDGNSLTLSQFLQNHFNDKTGALSIITSLVIIFFFTIYIASGFVGSAKLFAEVFDISYFSALIISVLLIVSYALIGGFLAVSWADLFQGLLMLAVLIFTPLYAFSISDFSFSDFINKTNEISPHHFDIFSNLKIAEVIGVFAWGLGYFGQPHIISKYMAIKDEKEIPTARRICIAWMTLSMVGAAIVGLFGVVYFAQSPLPEAETVFITMTSQLFHPLMIGILIAAILSAIMSTLNSQIIICCSSLAQDFYQRFWRKNASDREMLIFSRTAVVAVALVSLTMALDQNSSVLKLVGRAWAGLGASIGPVILFALFYPKTTKTAALVGIISGAVGAIIFSKITFFSYEILPAFCLSALLIFVVSFWQNKFAK
jgi:sodium/proline symporter